MESLLISAVTGLISAGATIAALRVDLGWVKNQLKDHEARLRALEGV